MSEYEYIHPTSGGPNLTICAFDKAEARVWVSSNRQPGGIGSYIPAADVPTVALELLKAAGQESVIVPKVESPVRPSGSGGELIECGHGARKVTVHREDSADKLREKAANYIALAEYVESAAAREAAEKAEAEAAEKKLQERRNTLLSAIGHGYEYEALGLNAPMRKAVDLIIQLKDKLDGASRD